MSHALCGHQPSDQENEKNEEKKFNEKRKIASTKRLQGNQLNQFEISHPTK